MKTSTIDWLITELKETNDENKALREELNNLREALADIILDPVTTTPEGNHLTGSQIRDRQIAAISALIFPPKIKPMMGLFNDTADDLADLKIGFKS